MIVKDEPGVISFGSVNIDSPRTAVAIPRPAGGNGLGDLGGDLLERQDIGVLILERSIEGAEAAAVDTDVCVVDVAVDDVGGDVGRVFPAAHRIRCLPEFEKESASWFWEPNFPRT